LATPLWRGFLLLIRLKSGISAPIDLRECRPITLHRYTFGIRNVPYMGPHATEAVCAERNGPMKINWQKAKMSWRRSAGLLRRGASPDALIARQERRLGDEPDQQAD
jgi:hypothetical protein